MENTKQNNREWQIAGRYLILLIKCALHELPLATKPEDCTWKQVWSLAKMNSVECTVSSVVHEMSADMPDEIWKEWSGASEQNLYRHVLFDMEREQIISKMAKQGIASLPLKGIRMAGYYPTPGMRWMCDNDILYGCKEQAQEKLCEIMENLGYTTVSLKGSHDVYQKKPFFNFEMHRSLVPEDSELTEYYANPWKKAVLTDEKTLQYRFTDEDEYLFHIAHAHKHFDNSGCGIRTLVDEYVILQAKKNLDWVYIENELVKTGLKDFEARLKMTALHAFDDKSELTEDDWKMIFYMLGCGTYGNSYNRVRRSMERLKETDNKDVKKRYLKSRFWIDEKKMKDFFPLFYKYKGIRFLLPGYRLIRGLLIHPGYLLNEWKAVNKYTSEERDSNKE